MIIEAIIESRRIFQRMLNYLMYATATTVGVVTRFSIAIWAFKFNMNPFMLLVMVFLNDGKIGYCRIPCWAGVGVCSLGACTTPERAEATVSLS